MRWLPATILAVLLTAFSVSPEWSAAQPQQSNKTAPKLPSVSEDIRLLLTIHCFECQTLTKKMRPDLPIAMAASGDYGPA